MVGEKRERNNKTKEKRSFCILSEKSFYGTSGGKREERKNIRGSCWMLEKFSGVHFSLSAQKREGWTARTRRRLDFRAGEGQLGRANLKWYSVRTTCWLLGVEGGRRGGGEEEEWR